MTFHVRYRVEVKKEEEWQGAPEIEHCPYCQGYDFMIPQRVITPRNDYPWPFPHRPADLIWVYRCSWCEREHWVGRYRKDDA